MKIRLLFTIAMTAILPFAGVFGCSSGVSNNAGNSNLTNTNRSENRSTPIDTGNVSVTANKTETDAPGGRLTFAKGESSTTVSGAVIRGERATYILGAKAGQTMSVEITSVENNAVFQIEKPDGKYLNKAGEGDDAMKWNGPLPANGDYKIIVGGTRGNASYRLTVSIK